MPARTSSSSATPPTSGQAAGRDDTLPGLSGSLQGSADGGRDRGKHLSCPDRHDADSCNVGVVAQLTAA